MSSTLQQPRTHTHTSTSAAPTGSSIASATGAAPSAHTNISKANDASVATAGSTGPGAGTTVTAHTHAPHGQQQTNIVPGEASTSVNVQSQLQTETVAGEVSSSNNLMQVVTDLGAAHRANHGWVEAETQRISQWGTGEIERILKQTQAMEQSLIKEAQERQKALDQGHTGEIEKLVRALDLKKAQELKDLEDGLQRQIQGVLSASKQDIHKVESEMNQRKMQLLQSAQVKSANEIDHLSNLVVQTKLVPSQTKTTIQTRTDTGHVVAVASGGEISTGSAASQSIGQAASIAVPNQGRVVQDAEVIKGDMVSDRTGNVVGKGEIVNSLTQVTDKPVQQGQGQQQYGGTAAAAGPMPERLSGDRKDALMHSSVGGAPISGELSQRQQQQQRDLPGTHDGQLFGATQRPTDNAPVDRNRVAGSTIVQAPEHHRHAHHDGEKSSYTEHSGGSSNIDRSSGVTHDQSSSKAGHLLGQGTHDRTARDATGKPVHIDAAYGVPMDKTHGTNTSGTVGATDSHTRMSGPDNLYGKHSGAGQADDSHRGDGLMDKVKRALAGHPSEPRSTDATTTRRT